MALKIKQLYIYIKLTIKDDLFPLNCCLMFYSVIIRYELAEFGPNRHVTVFMKHTLKATSRKSCMKQEDAADCIYKQGKATYKEF